MVVWPSRSMVSRAAAGIVTAAGLPWAIARSRSEYVALAVRLLGRREREATTGARRRVARARRDAPLFDLAAWVVRWESALALAVRAAAARRRSGRASPHIVGFGPALQAL